MFTRCPDCEAIFDISAWQFAQAAGFVRCGRCNKKYPCLKHLFDHWPEPGQESDKVPEPGTVPTLGQSLAEEAPDAQSEAEKEAEQIQAGGAGWLKPVWASLLIILIGVTLVNIAMTFQEPLLEQPQIRAAAEFAGLVESLPEVPFADLSLIQLVSRDIHPHPTVNSALVLSATMINRADQSQAYPTLEITLFDLQQRPLAQRRFAPGEYLDEASDEARGLSPGVLLPIVLEMHDPGPHAVGFEIRFL